MVSTKLKRKMRKAWKEYKKMEGTPSVSDAREALSFGVIDEKEFNSVKEKRKKEKYAHHALSNP